MVRVAGQAGSTLFAQARAHCEQGKRKQARIDASDTGLLKVQVWKGVIAWFRDRARR